MKRAACIALAIVLLPSIARAAARVELIESVAALETRNGAVVAVPFRGAAKLGQHLRYTIVAKNTGDRPALKLTPVQKIQAGERFLDGSAGALAEFSVDGGKTFAREPLVRDANAKPGAPALRRALPAEFDAVRWHAATPIAPGGSMTFSFDVVVE